MGSLSLHQGIFPTQGSNPGLLRCRRILYQLSHKGSPIGLTMPSLDGKYYDKVYIIGVHYLMGSIFISSKLFQITQQKKKYSSVSCITFFCYPTLLLVYPCQISPFHFHCKGEIVNLEQMAVMFQRSGTISESMLCLRFRKESFCFFLSFPLFPSWCFFFFPFQLGIPGFFKKQIQVKISPKIFGYFYTFLYQSIFLMMLRTQAL